MRCNVTQTFRQLIPNSPFISLIASIAEVYRGRTIANDMWLNLYRKQSRTDSNYKRCNDYKLLSPEAFEAVGCL